MNVSDGFGSEFRILVLALIQAQGRPEGKNSTERTKLPSALIYRIKLKRGHSILQRGHICPIFPTSPKGWTCPLEFEGDALGTEQMFDVGDQFIGRSYEKFLPDKHLDF